MTNRPTPPEPNTNGAPGLPDQVATPVENTGARPHPAVTRIATACAHALSGNHEQAEAYRLEALARIRGVTRRDRQRIEILSAVVEEHINRALALAFEHIEEFGRDPLMIDMLHRAVAERRDPVLSLEFAALVAQYQLPNLCGTPRCQDNWS